MKPASLSLLFAAALLALTACGPKPAQQAETADFQYVSEQFADLKILRYRVPGFDELSLQQKKLLYYLAEAAKSGRDIMWDQNYKYNLTIRRTLEAVISSRPDTAAAEWGKFMEYTKRVWFSNGIHHHYGSEKLMPEFSEAYFAAVVGQADSALLPLRAGETVSGLIARLTPVLFDPAVAAKKVNKDAGADIIAESAVNFYEGLTNEEVDAYYKSLIDPADTTPVSYGLNSKLMKENGQIVEKVWKVGGMYSPAIEKVVYWLEQAVSVAETEQQAKALQLLIEYYRTGDLKKFDEYSIAWVQDTASAIDVINGFIEVYNDPKGFKGSFESVVSIRDPEATKRIAAIGKEAQWFEDHSPILDEHKKKEVKGISARVINVVAEGGDATPSTPIGINLPNANWIRALHGSKSVNLANIVSAYEEAGKAAGGALEEFSESPEVLERQKQYGSLADALHTDMHEVIGHASGQIEAGVGTPKQTLVNYASTIEEGRADLVALYYLMDPKLVEMGLMPSLEAGKAAYDDYMMNGLMLQLRRIKPGAQIEEDHMRNRAFVAYWSMERGKADQVVEWVKRDGKTFVRINDYDKLRTIFGELLRETQRITSKGDFKAAQQLVETYGVKVDPALHQEVLDRYARLKSAPYSGFINPELKPVMQNGQIVDVKIEYPSDFTQQMLYYAKQYSFLPSEN